MSVVALVTDLIFGTKIRSTGEAVGVPVQIVRSADQLLARTPGSTLVLVDMNASNVDAADAILQLRRNNTQAKIIAYLSHVQHDLAQAAQQAGADEVMPRSAFSARLPEILKKCTGSA